MRRIIFIIKQATIILSSLHQQGKPRKLGSTVIDIQPIQVFLQDQPRNIAQSITALLIDGTQQIVGLNQNMTGTTGRIEHGQ
ncbi:hypothetical protein D9M68_736620 [compost metagenome]